MWSTRRSWTKKNQDLKKHGNKRHKEATKQKTFNKKILERQNSTLFHWLKREKQKDNIHSIARQFVTAGSGNTDAEAKENKEQEAWLSFFSDRVSH